MPSPYLTSVVKNGQPAPGRIKGLLSFEPIGDQTVFGGVSGEFPDVNEYEQPMNRLKQIMDLVFFWHRDRIYQLLDGVWTEVYTVPSMDSANGFAHHGGLHFWQDLATGNFGLVGAYQGTAQTIRAVRYDYLTDTWSSHQSPTGNFANNNYVPEQFFGGRLHFYQRGVVFEFDPVTLAWSNATGLPNTVRPSQKFLVADNRLFLLIATGGSPAAQIFQKVGGAWVEVASFNDASGGVNAKWVPLFYYWKGSLWVGLCVTAETHFDFWEVNATTFAVTNRETQLPSYLWTPNATSSQEREWRFWEIVDQEDVLGVPRMLILWQSGAEDGGINVYEHVQPGDAATASWSDLGSSQLTGVYSIPHYPNGGSDGVYSEGELFGMVTRAEPADSGVDYTMRFSGDPLVLEHGAVTGGPFVPGEVVTGGTSGATATVVRVLAGKLWCTPVGGSGTFQNAEVLTGGTSGATATTTADPSGGAANKFGRIRYDKEQDAANDLATLSAPASGLVSPMTLNANDYETVVADGYTDYKVKHETIADGIPNASPISLFVEVQRP